MSGCDARAQSGVALLTVMLILVFVITTMVYIIEDQVLMIHRVENQRDLHRAVQTAVLPELWVQKVLERDLGENRHDHNNEAWALELPLRDFMEPESPSFERVSVHDLQGRFNLNNLKAGRDEIWYPAFQRLLEVLDVDPSLADAVTDWVDEDLDVTGHAGAEDPQYLLMEPPYRAANRAMADVGELLWIRGFDPNIVKTLLPYVVALPESDLKINVNTATVELLRVLTTNPLDEARAQQILDSAGEEGYSDVEEVLTVHLPGEEGVQAEPMITVSSAYFEVRTRVLSGRVTAEFHSLIYRSPKTRQALLIQRKRSY